MGIEKSAKTYPNNSEKKKELDHKLALVIAVGMRPAFMLDEPSFRDWAHAMNPQYQVCMID